MVITIEDVTEYSRYLLWICMFLLWVGKPTPGTARCLTGTMLFTIGIYLAIRYR